YLVDTVWPAKLAVFYPYPSVVPPLLVIACLLMLGVISAFAWRQRGRRPYLLVGWLWYLVTLAPVIGIVQVGEQARADRYTYIPLIGVFVAVAWLAGEWAERSAGRAKFAATVSAVVLALLTVRTAVQVGVWRDSETLWTHAAAVTDDNWLAWNHLA